jgi:putative ribosome biogenesis GTPase RsgA
VVNALAGDELMAPGEVRSVDGKGRHTTTHRELVVLPSGAVVIDAPGLRDLSARLRAEERARWKSVHRAQRSRGGRP